MPSTSVALDYGQMPKNEALEAFAFLLSQEISAPINNTLPEEASPSLGTDVECISYELRGLVDWVDDAIEELDEIYKEFSEEDWDGYGAVALSPEAYYEARKFLINVPTFLPKPEITAEPDGGIGLEWYKDRGYSYIVSVNGNKTISYAGLFGFESETHGKESFFGPLPKIVIDGLKRLYPYESE
ncbi:MAG: hypothetical protein Q8P24_16645 [Desulfobacterales bacterium]|nr:hypothetical protein [Desulfobacterales bacterium]